MPPKPAHRRLAEIEAEIIATEVCTKLLRHAETVLAGVTAEPLLPPQTAVVIHLMPLFKVVVDLVHFAQTGKGAGARLLERFAAIFYTSPESAQPWRPLGEADAMATVYLAAQARIDLGNDLPVEHRALAALAGVHPSRIRQLGGGRDPVLPRAAERGTLQPGPAKAWLVAQKVVGVRAAPASTRARSAR